MTLVSGCGKVHSNENTEQLILPTIVEYSHQTQQRLAKELQTGSCRTSQEFIIDYGIMRDQTREALK